MKTFSMFSLVVGVAFCNFVKRNSVKTLLNFYTCC